MSLSYKSLTDGCLANKHVSKHTITGSTIVKYVRSPFLVWCDAFAPAEERDPQSRYLHLLFDRGIEHEKQVVKTLFPNAKHIPIKTMEETFRKVIEACFDGIDSLSGAPLFFLPENLQGVADVLVKNTEHGSIFGAHHYRIREIKSAKHIKHEYIMQAAFYNYLLGRIQGYTPPEFNLINRDRQEFSYRYERFEKELRETIDGIAEILNGKKVSPSAKGIRWPWESYAVKRAIAEHDISIVPQIGPSLRKKLNAVGINSAKDLLSAENPGDIIDSNWNKIKLYAKAWVEKKPIIISEPKLKASDTEIFLDFEGTDELQTEEGMIKVDYLVGILLKENETSNYLTFVAQDLTQEQKIMKDFFEFMQKFKDVPVYHYGNYERAHLAELGRKYNIGVSQITANMVDILSVLKKSIILPTISMSLKDVAKYLGFSWRDMASAQESIVLYLEYLETKDKKAIQRILDYNEDDVRATQVVKEFLAGLNK